MKIPVVFPVYGQQAQDSVSQRQTRIINDDGKSSVVVFNVAFLEKFREQSRNITEQITGLIKDKTELDSLAASVGQVYTTNTSRFELDSQLELFVGSLKQYVKQLNSAQQIKP